MAAPGLKVELWLGSGPAVETVEVPNLVGRSEETALALLQDRNLVPDRRQEPSSEPLGRVIRQSPEAGTEVAEGSSVTFVVSQGPPPVSVPEVLGETREEAEFRLTQAGLRVRVEETPSPEQAGIVIQQDPAADTQVPPDTEVTIVVSTGPPPTETTAPPSGAALPPGLGGNRPGRGNSG
jgi:serine/threonine-protein kinase